MHPLRRKLKLRFKKPEQIHCLTSFNAGGDLCQSKRWVIVSKVRAHLKCFLIIWLKKKENQSKNYHSFSMPQWRFKFMTCGRQKAFIIEKWDRPTSLWTCLYDKRHQLRIRKWVKNCDSYNWIGSMIIWTDRKINNSILKDDSLRNYPEREAQNFNDEVANCSITVITILISIAGNSLIVLSILKNPSLHVLSMILILGLALSDLQPLLFKILLMGSVTWCYSLHSGCYGTHQENFE